MGVSHLTQNEDLVTTVKPAMQSPLLDDIDLSQAQAAIVSVQAKDTIELSQYNQMGATVHQQLPRHALASIRLTVDPNLISELEVMVIATGIVSKPLADVSVPKPIEDKYINIHDFLGYQSTLNQARKSELIAEPSQNKYDVNDLQIPTYLRHLKQHSH